MIVEIAHGAGTAVLAAQDDFKGLKVVAAADADDARVRALLGAEPADEADHLWIPADTLRGLAVRTPEWDAAFDAMLTKVAPFGWYDPGTGKVKAHVERSA